MSQTTRPPYTEHLETRAAWYAAMSLDLEAQLEDASTLSAQRRLSVRQERLEAQIDADGLGALVEAARDEMAYDAERARDLIADRKPALPR